MRQNKITSADFEEEKNGNTSKINENKKTKSKSSAQKAMPIMIVVIISLLVILTCVLIAYYQVYNSGKQNANILEGVYASSYYSMVDNVNNLSVDIDKYSTLTTKQAKLNTLQDMMGDCDYILAGLSIMPIEHDNVVATTKFFNQVNGLCEAYSVVLNKDGALSQEQELMFDKIGLVLDKLKQNFNKQNASMYDSGFKFVDATIFDKTGMNELSNSMGDMTSESVEYPSMIFDGPFSTALETSVVKGLKGEEITKEQAKDYLKSTVYKNRENVEIEFDKETDGDVYTYDFDIELNGNKYFAQVSKVGKLLITLSGYAEAGDPIMHEEQAQEMAKTFANNIGFENMDVVWHETHENVEYVNLAPIENDVVMYPDLVKVKIDLTSQNVIGFEALNYAYNHIDRNPNFNVLESEAEKLLGFDYEVLKTTKTVIRLDSGKEVSAYEFMVERMDGLYFYYIDAATCEIVETMKLVTVEDVDKLI